MKPKPPGTKKLRLLIVSQYFSPENFRVNDLAQFMVEQGHEVVVVTGVPNYPFGKPFRGYSAWRWKRETLFGAEVLRVPMVPRGTSNRISLSLNFLSFSMSASISLLFGMLSGRKFDAIFVFAPSPITVAIPGIMARWKFSAPSALWVLDLWPQSLAAVGAIKATWILNGVGEVVKWIYRHFDVILAQSETFKRSIKLMDIPESRLDILPNWGEDVFSALPADDPSLAAIQIRPGFRIVYAGNIGVAQDFPAILEAAEFLKEDPGVQWVIVGEGRMREWAEQEVQRRELGGTVQFLGQRPLEDMPAIYAEADALLVSLRDEPAFSEIVPGKMQSCLAAGKPILAMLNGEGADVVDRAQAGFSCPAGKAPELARLVKKLVALPAGARKQLGMNGRRYFEDNFARQRVLSRLEQLLASLSETSRGRQ